MRTECDVWVDHAAAYRLAGRDDTSYTQLSAAVPGEPGVCLLNEFGLGCDKARASDLVKIDVHGRVVDGTSRRVNPSGFSIHDAVHAAHPNVECVIHLHEPQGVALAMLPGGLQLTSQWARRLHWCLGRHAYEGRELGADGPQRLVAHLESLAGPILRPTAR
jgi:ribulose-5-phosphate 4-epimerase/fuculose-1-phosphate aldolase